MDVYSQFKLRLKRRGYNDGFLSNLFSKLPNRHELLEQLMKEEPTSKPRKLFGPVFVAQLPKLKHRVNLKVILKVPSKLKEHPKYIETFGDNDIIIGRRNNRSLGSLIARKPPSDSLHHGGNPLVGGTGAPVIRSNDNNFPRVVKPRLVNPDST